MRFLRPRFLARTLCAILLAAPLAAATPVLSQREEWVEAGETPGCFNWTVESPSGVLYGYSGEPGDLHRSEDGGATWTALPAPPTYIASIVVRPADPATLYAVAQGFYVSRDAGQTWERSLSAPSYLYGDLTIDPFLPETFYVTSTCCYNGTLAPHVWMSSDGGERWVERSDGLYAGEGFVGTFELIADPRTPGVLLTSLTTGVYRTVDRGGHWSRISETDVGRLRGFDTTSSEIVWSVAAQGVMRSTDGGVTWSTSDVKIFEPEVPSVVDLIPDPAWPGIAYASVNSSLPDFYLFASSVRMTTDGGATWTLMEQDVETLASTARGLALGEGGRKLWTTTCGTPNAVYRLDLRRPREPPPR